MNDAIGGARILQHPAVAPILRMYDGATVAHGPAVKAVSKIYRPQVLPSRRFQHLPGPLGIRGQPATKQENGCKYY